MSMLLVAGVASAGTSGWLANPNDDPRFGDATPDEQFGEALALDGDRLAVGAPEGYDSAGLRSGRVRVFHRSGTGWAPLADVESPVGQDQARFGSGLALQGNTLVVGARGFDRGTLWDLGVVQVFEFDGTRFQPRQELTDPEGGSLFFGNTIALDGDTLAITRSISFSNPGAYAGEVVLYARIGSQWVLQQVLRSPVPYAYDGFGAALALVGDLLVVGSFGESFNGAAYAYAREGGRWVLEQRLAVPAGESDQFFGYALASDGQRLLVGAPSFQQSRPGAVYEFRRRPGGWDAGPRRSIEGIVDLRQFGVRIARHGARWVIGAVAGEDLADPRRIELFGYVESAGALVIERQASLDYLASTGNALRTLATDGQSIVVGLPTVRAAPWADAGEVRVVPLLPTAGGVVSLNTGATAVGEQFGGALAAPAGWLLVGAPGERRNSAQAGIVYAWPFAAGEPGTGEPQLLRAPDVPRRGGFGSAMATSGATVLVGAPDRIDGGSVHAFEHDGLDWRMTATWRLQTAQRDGFGSRIAAQADRFVVGTAQEFGPGGAAYVIERVPGGWTPPVPLVPADALPPSLGWIFGSDVAIDDAVVAVGARRILDTGFGWTIPQDGAAYVFARARSGWAQLARLERPAGTAAPADFGSAVAVRGQLVAVGAPLGGEVHLFAQRANGEWAWDRRIDGIAAAAGGFGSRLRFVGDELWVAAPATGSLHRYRRVGAEWRLVQQLRDFSALPGDQFGIDFTRVGDSVVIGAPRRTGHRSPIAWAGAVRLDEVSLFGDQFEP